MLKLPLLNLGPRTPHTPPRQTAPALDTRPVTVRILTDSRPSLERLTGAGSYD